MALAAEGVVGEKFLLIGQLPPSVPTDSRMREEEGRRIQQGWEQAMEKSFNAICRAL